MTSQPPIRSQVPNSLQAPFYADSPTTRRAKARQALIQETSPTRLAVEQFFACAKTRRSIPDDLQQTLTFQWQQHPPDKLKRWYKQFSHDVFQNTLATPTRDVAVHPYTETVVDELLKDWGVLADCPEKLLDGPSLVLTHDIDTLNASLRFRLRRIAQGEQGFSSLFRSAASDYLRSLQQLLVINQGLASPHTTVFVASSELSSNPFHWPSQWLNDPIYRQNTGLMNELLDLIQQQNGSVGLLSSTFAFQSDLLYEERATTQQTYQAPVLAHRHIQLSTPRGRHAYWQLAHAGLSQGAGLGWKTTCGFRGGMARPFPLLLGFQASEPGQSSQPVWQEQIPLLLMDTALFRQFSTTDQVVNHAKRLLSPVLTSQGSVALNWHGYSAANDYQWHYAYEQILEWAASQGASSNPILKTTNLYSRKSNDPATASTPINKEATRRN